MLTNAHNFVGHVGYMLVMKMRANDLHKMLYKSKAYLICRLM